MSPPLPPAQPSAPPTRTVSRTPTWLKDSRYLLFALAISLATWLYGGVSVKNGYLSSLISFGALDHLEYTFAPVNAFFTGISGIGLMITIYLQMKGMRQLREDTDENQRILTEQLDQAKAEFATNRSESVFFELLKIHRENSKALQESKINSRNTMERLKNGYKQTMQYAINIYKFNNNITHLTHVLKRELNEYDSAKQMFTELSKENMRIFICAAIYWNLFNSQQHILSPYYRHLYHMIRFAEKEAHDAETKKLYMQIIRSQIDPYSQAMLMYNALFYYKYNIKELGEENAGAFKLLIEDNAILHEMDDEVLPHIDHKKLYDDRAFGTA